VYQETEERTVVYQLSSAIAQAMEFSRSENVEWIISDKRHLILHRPEAPDDPIHIKKNAELSSEKS